MSAVDPDTNPPRPTAAEWLLLPLRPWTLARVAERAGPWGTYLGSIVVPGLSLLAVTGWIGGWFSSIVVLIVLALVALPAIRWPLSPSAKAGGAWPRRYARERAVLLNHTALLLPLLSLVAVVLAPSRPGLAGGPSFSVAGCLFLGIYVLNLQWAFLRIGRDLRRR